MSRDAKDERREHYRHITTVPTRWIDNDIYGHVNNAVYYTYFDTVVNAYLITEGGLDPANGAVIGFAVETGCKFLSPIAFPDTLNIALRIGKLGNSSVRYELAVFRAGQDEPCAVGYFVHVFVHRETQRPTPIGGKLRAAMVKLLMSQE